MGEPTDLVMVSLRDVPPETRAAYRKLGRDIVNAPRIWTLDRRTLVGVPRSFAAEHGLEVERE